MHGETAFKEQHLWHVFFFFISSHRFIHFHKKVLIITSWSILNWTHKDSMETVNCGKQQHANAHVLTIDGAIIPQSIHCLSLWGSFPLTCQSHRSDRQINTKKRLKLYISTSCMSRFNAEVASNEQILHHNLRKCEIFASKYPLDCDIWEDLDRLVAAALKKVFPDLN